MGQNLPPAITLGLLLTLSADAELLVVTLMIFWPLLTFSRSMQNSAFHATSKNLAKDSATTTS
jgi:hypothetical protein